VTEPTDTVDLELAASEDEARQWATALVEHGIGATVEPEEQGWAVQVLGVDAARAREVLGIVEDEDPEAEHEDLARVARLPLVAVLLGGAALVIVPLVAFYVAYKLNGG
jgi:hypothetical protein